MREVEAKGIVHVNPADADSLPDGAFGGHPITADPDIPAGFAQMRQEIPPEMASETHTVIGFDPAVDDGPLIAGHRDQDGVLHIDSVRMPVHRPGQGELVERFSRLRPTSDFIVDLDAPPNSCTRCGIEQRDHGEQHAYSEPTNSVRLARMKSRRTKRFAAPPQYYLAPTLFLELSVDATALATALRGLGESLRPLVNRARETRELIEAISQRTDERIAAWRARRETDGLDWGDALTEADANWPAAQGGTCAHICGADPDHACNARAAMRLAYNLPSGGTRSMPICAPCHASESAVNETAPVVPLPDALLDALESHLAVVRSHGRTPCAVLIGEQEAARWGADGATTVFGIPWEYDASVPLGRYRMRLDDGTLQEAHLPAWFTED
jgi:hypothetical protein